MPEGIDGLTAAQARAVAHRGGPLLVLGGAGTGKTTALVERFAWLVREGTAPEAIVALTTSAAAADDLRRRIEDRLDRPYEELAVHAPAALGARLLREEAVEAALDPFVIAVGPGDRLAMLLERVDELSVRRHDFAGEPAALLARLIERIDRLKAELVTAADFERWAAALPVGDEAARARAEREREFAGLYAAHDRMLAQRGALDEGDVLLRVLALLDGRPHVRARVGARVRHVLVDELQDLSTAGLRLVELLAAASGGGAGRGHLWAAAGDDGSVLRAHGAATRNVEALRAVAPAPAEVALDYSHRCPERVLAAAHAVVAPARPRLGLAPAGRRGGELQFWRCANERAQAQAAAAEVERLVRAGTPPEEIAVLVRSVRREGQAVAAALEERAVPYRVVGAGAFFRRAEIRDVLAWLRLLVDPNDAGAAVRALARPPIELRSVDLARCVQIARRRKLDMVGALVAATESPQLPPEARERVLAFLKLHRSFSAALDTARADLFVHRLIERLGLRRQQLFTAQADVVERLVNLARLAELAGEHVRRAPSVTPRELARSLAAVADAGLREEEAEPAQRPRAVQVMSMQAAKGREVEWVFVLGLHGARMPGGRSEAHEPLPEELVGAALGPDDRAAHVAGMRRLLHVAMTRARTGCVLAHATASARGAAQPVSPFVEEARAAVDGVWEEREEELFGPAETLPATYTRVRDEVLRDVARAGKALGELRFDTDLDVAHATARYLELLKLGALLERPAGQSVADALPSVNERILGAATPMQREILLSSSLDDTLLGAERADSARAAATAARTEPSLEAFLPRRGDGLMLSASDIETYRTCPLKYKFARVFRIPQEPTLNQRFGIVVHQVLERFHGEAVSPTRSLDELLGLLDGGWRRAGLGDGDQERQLRDKAESALRRYHARFRDDDAEPVWLERAFSFRMGPHTLRGRVDRVDRLPGGGYELIDYKTGRPKTATALRDDVQLSLYAVGAREAWELEAADQAYLYVLDDEKVRVPTEDIDPAWITDTVMEVADGIQGQGFEPTPSYAACSMCDYRIACPAAER